MPFTWRINIRANPKPPGPAIFEFEVNPPQIQIGDQIIWSNTDTVAHWPRPGPPSYQSMPNRIAPQSTSPAFAPGNQGTINYVCALHADEKASFAVGAAPPQG